MKNLRPFLLLTLAFVLVQCIASNNGPSSPIRKKVEDINWQHFESQNSLQSAPELRIEGQVSEAYALSMQEVSIDIKVMGSVATTTLEMVFYNDADRVLEGELVFPLSEGHTVSRFAMEVNGALREAVAVEKQEARVAFENTVRKQIDPGLLELTKGNTFKARVYPIPAKGTKTVVIAYEQELYAQGGNLLYHLPLNFEEPVASFKAKAVVFREKEPLEVSPNCLEAFDFTRSDFDQEAQVFLQNNSITKDIIFGIPQRESQKVLIEADEYAHKFLIQVNTNFERAAKNPIHRLSILWDASGSASAKNKDAETKLLKDYLALQQNVWVEFLHFSNEVHGKHEFQYNGDFSEIQTHINSLVYDGGTQLGCIDFQTLQGEESLLFSDGIGNFGQTAFMDAKRPVHVVCSYKETDYHALKRLAYSSGGSFINLNQTLPEKALELLSTAGFYYMGMEPNDHVSEVYPNRQEPVKESFSLAGELLKDDQELTLLFGNGSTVSHREKVFLNTHNYGSSSGLITKIWAQKKLDALILQQDSEKEEIIELCKAYSLVSEYTSLLVLDRVEDYAEHGIEPPAALKWAYDSLLATQVKDSTTDASSIDAVVADFQQYVDWWNENWKQKVPKKEDERVSADSLRTRYFYANHDGLGDAQPRLETSAPEENMPAMELNANANNRPPPPPEIEIVNDEEAIEEFDMDLAEEPGTYSLTYASSDNTHRGSIEVAEWNPEAEYLEELKQAQDSLYEVYLKLKKTWGNGPAYYLDASDLFFEKGDTKTGLRVLSNIAELKHEEASYLRILAHRLEQLNYLELAILSFEDVAEMRAEEPQSFRDLGLAYAKKGDTEAAVKALYQVVTGDWSSRFGRIEALVAFEMNQVIAKAQVPPSTAGIDERLLLPMPCDIRVILNWDTDACDMDLWVTDPDGEKCYYKHKQTATGGLMSDDLTQGYGPEQFIIKNALKGAYKVEVNYYGTRSQKAFAPTTVQVEMITNYGRSNETTQQVTRRLGKKKEVLEIGSFSMN